jgi:hypothetical protein
MNGEHEQCNDLHSFYDGEWFYSAGGQLFPGETTEFDIDFSWEVDTVYQTGDEYVGEGFFKRKKLQCFLRATDWTIQFLEEKYNAEAVLTYHCVWAESCPPGYFLLDDLVALAKKK